MDKPPEGEHREEQDREPVDPSIHGTVEFLVRRMRHKGDLPTFSRHIIEINNKLASLTAINLSSTGELANIILKDFSLTNKLLRVVNSAFYGNLSGRVTTVSKAVFLLGFEKVRMIAAALMIFEHLQNKSELAELQEATVASYVSGILATDLAEQMKVDRKEEAFICAMLFNLGKVLVICYFPEEYQEIKKRMIENTIDENSAARSVLGIAYKELGMAISKSWNFPDKIVHSMEGLPAEDIKKPRTEQEVLQHLANYSHDLCDIVANSFEGDMHTALESLARRYQNSIALNAAQSVTLLETATAKVDQYSEVVRVNPKTSSLLKNIKKLGQPERAGDSGAGPERQPTRAGGTSGTSADALSRIGTQEKEQAQTLQNGIQEIADVMKGTYNLGDVISMIMETMYRGFLFDRVVFAMRDVTRTKMVGRFGLGEEIDGVIGHFTFEIRSTPDIFNIAIARAKGIVINDAESPSIVRSLPEWYRLTIAAPAFLIYPIVVREICIGVIYADRKTKGALLTESQMEQMEELRKLAVDAIEQKRQGEA
ncbi:MAG: HDOD domain-containing protein [Syntrophales bacterium]|jgi:HD-like signal output (HDOD) protein|nr:HDOD domain-containing protein [Syntrophales bacterium]